MPTIPHPSRARGRCPAGGEVIAARARESRPQPRRGLVAAAPRQEARLAGSPLASGDPFGAREPTK